MLSSTQKYIPHHCKQWRRLLRSILEPSNAREVEFSCPPICSNLVRTDHATTRNPLPWLSCSRQPYQLVKGKGIKEVLSSILPFRNWSWHTPQTNKLNRWRSDEITTNCCRCLPVADEDIGWREGKRNVKSVSKPISRERGWVKVWSYYLNGSFNASSTSFKINVFMNNQIWSG